MDPPNYMGQTPSLLQPSALTDSAPCYKTLNIKVKIGTEILGLAQNAYPNRNRKPRGRALIINYDKFPNARPRTGSEVDVIHLDQLLQQLGYTVTLKTNLNLVVSFVHFFHFLKIEIELFIIQRKLTMKWKSSPNMKIIKMLTQLLLL